jgi:AAA ATPase domain
MVGATFVGRQGELERLGRMLRGDPGATSAAVVTGDAGIGKTRLLREAARAAPEVKVLVGACLPLSDSLPYGAVTDALAVLSSPENRPTLDQALVRCAPFVRGRPPTADGRDPSPGPTRSADAARSGCDAAGTGHVGRPRGGIHAA